MKKHMTKDTKRRDGQRGMALILAIIFMALLSILGAVVLDVANREIKMVAGYRAGGEYAQDRAGLLPEKEAFYAVDRTVEYSLNTRIIEDINKRITDGNPPVIVFRDLGVLSDSSDDNLGEYILNADGTYSTTVRHADLIAAGGGLSLWTGSIRQLGIATLSFAQINRIANGASADDIFIRYHLNAKVCPNNVNCDAYPREAARVDAHLIEVRPNPSGSGGSSEETGDSIWGKG